ncbi:hypothetical protein V8C42DRAFT_310698 [Trichoderma barbatum]
MPGTTDKRLSLAILYVTVPCLMLRNMILSRPLRFEWRIGVIVTASSYHGVYGIAGSGRMAAVFVYLIRLSDPMCRVHWLVQVQ